MVSIVAVAVAVVVAGSRCSGAAAVTAAASSKQQAPGRQQVGKRLVVYAAVGWSGSGSQV